jgi:hypothetical protein
VVLLLELKLYIEAAGQCRLHNFLDRPLLLAYMRHTEVSMVGITRQAY